MSDQEKREIIPDEQKPIKQPRAGDEDIFSATEIKIEEMAIDGICGVY